MYPLASLIAVIVASEPVLTSLTLSIEGKFPIINLDNSISISVGAQNKVPILSCCETAEIISFLV
ncbi:hypothetical protein MnTg01_00011 [archaeon MnTg01]|nr:hypothetical protein MnTg01_00011 [archaeon MnTg01]